MCENALLRICHVYSSWHYVQAEVEKGPDSSTSKPQMHHSFLIKVLRS